MGVINMHTYENPVMRGFYPDPSVVRVGEDYYLVNSTFQYFPAIPIHHSKDLVHWECIGHVITEDDQMDLRGLADSNGIWACDISYYNGEFYVFATLRLDDPPANPPEALRKVVTFKSDKPEGPYRRMGILDINFIDPSHFVDDDGSHYAVTAVGLTITKLTDDCSALDGPIIQAWPGTGDRCPEGPHILKKDGWYYAILAEGGTGMGHKINVGRSRHLYGPYEACPHNPIMNQPDPSQPIQRTGHGKFVQTQNGDWWVMYLCGRKNGDLQLTTLGRETALDPVTWDEEGWPMVNQLQGPSYIQQAPDLPWTPYPVPGPRDDFDQEQLAPCWIHVRNPKREEISLTKRPGWLTLRACPYDLCELEAYNQILRREQEFCYTGETLLEMTPEKDGQEAGLTCYYGTACYMKAAFVRDQGLKVRLTKNDNREFTVLGEACLPENTQRIWLRVQVEGLRRVFFYSLDGEKFTEVGREEAATYLGDEGVRVSKSFTGTMVGMYAYNPYPQYPVEACFDWFSME